MTCEYCRTSSFNDRECRNCGAGIPVPPPRTPNQILDDMQLMLAPPRGALAAYDYLGRRIL